MLESLRSAKPHGLAQVVADAKRPLTKDEVTYIAARLTRAKEERDWRAYRDCLQALAWAKHPSAQRVLLDLMADPAIRFPERVGAIFKDGLLESDLPGVTEAARMRFEQQVEAGEMSWIAAEGWFELIAAHANEEEVAWLLEQRQSGQIHDRARRALAQSRKPSATRYVLKQFRNPTTLRQWGSLLSEFARANPTLAHELISELILTSNERIRSWSRSGFGHLMRQLGNATTPETLPQTIRLLRGLNDRERQLASVYAVQALKRGGHDVTALTEIIDLPRTFLAEWTRESDAGSWFASRLRQTIAANRITWSEEIVAALESTATRVGRSGLAGQGYLNLAAKIRAHLASEWR